MENVVAKLLEDFERGRMTRHQLIKSLALIAAAARATAASEEESKGFKPVAVNHISYQVNDYAKTRDFYADLLGMKVVGDTGIQCNWILSSTNTFVVPRNAPPGTRRRRLTTWRTIEYRKTNEVKTESERRGLNPPDTENSFHIKDPNGFDLQISGKDMNLPSVSRLRSLSVEARFILSI